MKTLRTASLPLLAALFAAGCGHAPKAGDTAAAAFDAPLDITGSFAPRGQAGMDRLDQDETQRICSEYEGKPVPPELVTTIMEAANAGIRFPADGNYLGDWKNGEKIAKTGTGLQSNDDPNLPNGGNCYACHQMAAEEIAYGTIAPSLGLYGKLRGNSEPILKYTWTRLWNSHAYNACSHMPRFGEKKILDEQQLKDVMAYLFDPQSPVNLEAPGKN